MASLSATWVYQGKGGKFAVSAHNSAIRKPRSNQLQTSYLGSFPSGKLHGHFGFHVAPKAPLLPCIKCEKEDEEYFKEEEEEDFKDTEEDEEDFEDVLVERPPYYSYFDSTSGRMEPATGARASIPGQQFWPEGTADRVRAARAPAPQGVSEGSPSFGKSPGSRRNYKASAAAHQQPEAIVEFNDDAAEPDNVGEAEEETKDDSSEYVIYRTEPKKELTGYELDKEIGRPHPFIDPKKRRYPEEGKLPNEELWWQWREPDKGQWSRWQRRRPDSETVLLKATAETGQVKIFGEHPTVTESNLYRARKHLFKEERLQAERDRLEKDGPIDYYSEWVSKYEEIDTSREAVQKRFEETGLDENAQLIEMFCHQTAREYRIMMGTDLRIQRDPLAMRMTEDQIKQIWGGDPVYPTINYIRDPNERIDYRGAQFSEPAPNMVDYLKERGILVPQEEIDKRLAKQKVKPLMERDIDEDAMAKAVDIGENVDDGEDSEADGKEEEVADAEEEKEQDKEEDADDDDDDDVRRPQPPNSKKQKPKKNGSMTLKEAIDDSENLTDFLMDFDEGEAEEK